MQLLPMEWRRAFANGPRAVAQLLAEDDVDVNGCASAAGTTPLLVWVSSSCSRESLGLLLAAGANLNLQTLSGLTPVMRAAGLANIKDTLALQLLIEAGADIEIEEINGTTALEQAASRQQWSVARMLIEAGARRIPGGCQWLTASLAAHAAEDDATLLSCLAQQFAEDALDDVFEEVLNAVADLVRARISRCEISFLDKYEKLRPGRFAEDIAARRMREAANISSNAVRLARKGSIRDL